MIARSKSLSLSIAVSMLLVLGANVTNALERRSTQQIPVDELVKETMQFAQIEADSMSLAWYIPLEAFETTPPQPVLIIGVLKAKILSPDNFKFASESEVQKELKVTYTDASGTSVDLIPASKSEDISGFMTEMKPFFSKLAGKFGDGMWFFAYKNVSSSGKKIASPYEFGKLKISLNGKDDRRISSMVDFPLNSLFIPRLCPNGKPAHVSWKYCPWDGTPLPKK